MNTDECKLKTHDIILLVLIVILAGFGLLTYFHKPEDPDNAKLVVGAIIAAVTVVLTFKFSIHQAVAPLLPPDTKQVTETKTPPTPPPDPKP